MGMKCYLPPKLLADWVHNIRWPKINSKKKAQPIGIKLPGWYISLGKGAFGVLCLWDGGVY